MQPVAAQVEIAVLESDIFGIVGLAGDRHRQLGSAWIVPRLGDHLDLAGVELGVHRPALAHHHLAGDRHHRLDPETIERLERLAARGANHLGQP